MAKIFSSFQLDKSDLTLSEVRGYFTQQGDIGYVPEGFSPQAVFFDMDATLIGQESLVEMARLLGAEKETERITEQAMRGEIDFRASLLGRLQVLRGVPVSVFDRVLPQLSLNPGIEEFVAACKAHGVACFIISGGFTDLAARFAEQLGFTGFCANQLVRKDGKLTGEVDGKIIDAAAKAAYVQEMITLYGYDRRRVIAIGDGANDIAMMQVAGLGVGYHAKPALYPYLHVHIGQSDFKFLRDILFLR